MSIPKPKTVLHKRLSSNIWWQHLNSEDIYTYTISFFAALVKGCRGFLFCVLCFCYSASVTSRLGHSELHTPSDRFFWTPFSKYSSQWLECGYCWRLYANVYYIIYTYLYLVRIMKDCWHDILPSDWHCWTHLAELPTFQAHPGNDTEEQQRRQRRTYHM